MPREKGKILAAKPHEGRGGEVRVGVKIPLERDCPRSRVQGGKDPLAPKSPSSFQESGTLEPGEERGQDLHIAVPVTKKGERFGF